jgi:hypothetical protein
MTEEVKNIFSIYIYNFDCDEIVDFINTTPNNHYFYHKVLEEYNDFSEVSTKKLNVLINFYPTIPITLELLDRGHYRMVISTILLKKFKTIKHILDKLIELNRVDLNQITKIAMINKNQKLFYYLIDNFDLDGYQILKNTNRLRDVKSIVASQKFSRLYQRKTMSMFARRNNFKVLVYLQKKNWSIDLKDKYIWYGVLHTTEHSLKFYKNLNSFPPHKLLDHPMVSKSMKNSFLSL